MKITDEQREKRGPICTHCWGDHPEKDCPSGMQHESKLPLTAAYESLAEANRQVREILARDEFDYDVPPGDDAGSLRDKLRGLHAHIAGSLMELDDLQSAEQPFDAVQEAKRMTMERWAGYFNEERYDYGKHRTKQFLEGDENATSLQMDPHIQYYFRGALDALRRSQRPEDSGPREDDYPKAYPEKWPKLHNASHEPCDMLRGPCACGAWHRGDDQAMKAVALFLSQQAFRDGLTQ